MGEPDAALTPEQEVPRLATSRFEAVAWWVLVLVGLVLLVHWPVLGARALAPDDARFLADNHVAQNLSWASTWRCLTELRPPEKLGGRYQPLTTISLMIDHAFGGRLDKPLVFRLTSLVLHLLNVVLVWALLDRLFERRWAAGLVALLWGMHPMAVEPICIASARGTLLSAFCALLSLLAYTRYARRGGRRAYGLSLGGFVLALAARPAVAPLAPGLLLLDYWPLRRLSRRGLLEKIPFLAIAGLLGGIGYASVKTCGGAPGPGVPGTAGALLLSAHDTIVALGMIVWPVGLSPYHPRSDPLTLSDPAVATGLAGMALLVAGMLVSSRSSRAVPAGALFFLAMILPLMHAEGSGDVAAAREAYLPAVGLMLPAVYLLGGIRDRSPRPGRSRLRAGVAAAILMLLTALAAGRARAYDATFRDTERLLRYMLRRAPNAAVLYNHLGVELWRQQRPAEAREHFELARAIDPDDSLALLNLAKLSFEQGDGQAALEHISRAVELAPGTAEAQYTMGRFLVMSGRPDAGADYFTQTLNLDPEHFEALHALSLIHLRAQRYPEALDHLSRALAIRPNDAQVNNNCGLALLRLGRYEEAIARFSKAVRLDPLYAKAHANLALALEHEGHLDRAIEHYRQALNLDQDDANLWNNLGVLLAKQGNLDKAHVCFLKAIQLAPGHADAQRNAAQARARLQRQSQPASQSATGPASQPASQPASDAADDRVAGYPSTHPGRSASDAGDNP